MCRTDRRGDSQAYIAPASFDGAATTAKHHTSRRLIGRSSLSTAEPRATSAGRATGYRDACLCMVSKARSFMEKVPPRRV